MNIEDFVLFLKTNLEKQYREYLENRVASGQIGKDGYDKAVGILDALRSTQFNIDSWFSDFKKGHN